LASKNWPLSELGALDLLDEFLRNVEFPIIRRRTDLLLPQSGMATPLATASAG